MKYTLENLEKLDAKNAEATKRVNDEISKKEAEIDAIEDEMIKVIGNGDMDKYAELFTKSCALKSAVAAYQNAAAPKLGYTDADVAAGWAEYVAAHNKKIEAALTEYNDAKKKLFDKMVEIAAMRNEAISVREQYRKHLVEPKENKQSVLAHFFALPRWSVTEDKFFKFEIAEAKARKDSRVTSTAATGIPGIYAIINSESYVPGFNR